MKTSILSSSLVVYIFFGCLQGIYVCLKMFRVKLETYFGREQMEQMQRLPLFIGHLCLLKGTHVSTSVCRAPMFVDQNTQLPNLPWLALFSRHRVKINTFSFMFSRESLCKFVILLFFPVSMWHFDDFN